MAQNNNNATKVLLAAFVIGASCMICSSGVAGIGYVLSQEDDTPLTSTSSSSWSSSSSTTPASGSNTGAAAGAGSGGGSGSNNTTTTTPSTSNLGRYVRVTGFPGEALIIAEIDVRVGGDNVAAGKPVKQSSENTSFGFAPSHITDARYQSWSATLRDAAEASWVFVDLGTAVKIDSITVHGALGYNHLLNGAVVEILNAAMVPVYKSDGFPSDQRYASHRVNPPNPMVYSTAENTYGICNVLTGKCLENGGGKTGGNTLQAWTWNGEDHQLWTVRGDSASHVTICNKKTNNCIENKKNDANVAAYPNDQSMNKKWEFHPNGTIKSLESGRALENKEDVHVKTYNDDGHNNKRWYLKLA